MLSQSHSTLELHQRVLADLDQREAAVMEQEAEARRVLEQALAHCAAERTSIEQDRAVLEQAAKLYRRFIDTGGGKVPEDNVAQPEPAPEQEPCVMDEPASPPPAADGGACVAEPSVMELRRQLWKENQMDGIAQREAWAADQPPPNAPTGPPY
jgi:hypothetical protein